MDYEDRDTNQLDSRSANVSSFTDNIEKANYFLTHLQSVFVEYFSPEADPQFIDEEIGKLLKWLDERDNFFEISSKIPLRDGNKVTKVRMEFRVIAENDD